MSRRALVPLAGAILGGGFYLLLIDTTSTPELILLVGVALGCGAALALALEQGFVEAEIRPRWLLGGVRLLLAIPRDVIVVCAEAVAQLIAPRPVRGAFRSTPFRATGATSADTGRRALTETLGSVAPNTIVVGVDVEHGRLLVHQLRVGGAARDLDLLRLG